VAEPLHCVTVALVVLPLGAQRTVLPPPVADPMHWSTVTPAVVVPTGTLLVTVTSQYTLLPPPVTMPLHWFTDVTSWLDEVVLTTGPRFSGHEGKTTPAAPSQALMVTVELVAPVEDVLFTTVTAQVIWNPAEVGMSGGLHWLTDGAVFTAACAWPGAASADHATTESTASRPMTHADRVRDDLAGLVVVVPGPAAPAYRVFFMGSPRCVVLPVKPWTRHRNRPRAEGHNNAPSGTEQHRA
jgi:hypothetical protein